MIRDHSDHWIKGYSRALGTTNSFIAELWALRNGLIIAKDLGLNNLIVELDALSVVHMINNNTSNLLIEPLLSDSTAFIEKFLTNRYNMYIGKLINVLML